MSNGKLTYDEWMVKVNNAILARTGVFAADLADFCYEDRYEDGYTPAQAAKAAIAYDQGDDEEDE